MKLFLKGFIIGIAKIIPGVSGAMIALNFNVYDKLINSITHFTDNKKENLKFLLIIGFGIILAIILFSNLIKYFINKYYLITMMFFIGLITGGTYHYSKKITFNIKNIIIIIISIFIVILFSLLKINNTLTNSISNNYFIYFLGGVIEIFSSIVPGISGTALYMLMNIYDEILLLFSNIYNISFIIDNILIYISYGIGLFVSFIIFSILISYILKKYRNIFDTIVLGFSIASILLLIIMSFKNSFLIIDLIIGIIFLLVGVVVSYFFN